MLIDVPVDEIDTEKTAQFLYRPDDIVVDAMEEVEEGEKEYFVGPRGSSQQKRPNGKKQSKKRQNSQLS